MSYLKYGSIYYRYPTLYRGDDFDCIILLVNDAYFLSYIIFYHMK